MAQFVLGDLRHRVTNPRVGSGLCLMDVEDGTEKLAPAALNRVVDRHRLEAAKRGRANGSNVRATAEPERQAGDCDCVAHFVGCRVKRLMSMRFEAVRFELIGEVFEGNDGGRFELSHAREPGAGRVFGGGEGAQTRRPSAPFAMEFAADLRRADHHAWRSNAERRASVGIENPIRSSPIDQAVPGHHIEAGPSLEPTASDFRFRSDSAAEHSRRAFLAAARCEGRSCPFLSLAERGADEPWARPPETNAPPTAH